MTLHVSETLSVKGKIHPESKAGVKRVSTLTYDSLTSLLPCEECYFTILTQLLINLQIQNQNPNLPLKDMVVAV